MSIQTKTNADFNAVLRASKYKNLVIYGIIPRSFTNEGIRGITKKLNYIKDLGANAIWLTPIFQHSLHDFGYGITDFMKLSEECGTAEDLRKLVSTAHDLGLKVILDVAPNHTSDEHPYFRDAYSQRQNSVYWDYYVHDEKGEFEYYFNWRNLLNLNYDNPAVQTMMIEALSYWVKEYDIDGYRMDSAWGIRNRTPGFWPKCIDDLRKTKKDLILIAEASGLDNYYFEAGFDAAYDWDHHLGHWPWRHSFNDLSRLVKDLSYHLSKYPATHTMLHFLNNNDTGQRFISQHGEQMTRLAAALLLALPGMPCIFMGDEVGAEFEPYQIDHAIEWPLNDDLFNFYQRLVSLRYFYHPTSQHIELLPTGYQDILAFTRPSKYDLPILFIYNFGDDKEIKLNLSYSGIKCLNLWNLQKFEPASNRLSIPIQAKKFAVLEFQHQAS